MQVGELSGPAVPLVPFLPQIVEQVGEFHLQLEDEVFVDVVRSQHLFVEVVPLVCVEPRQSLLNWLSELDLRLLYRILRRTALLFLLVRLGESGPSKPLILLDDLFVYPFLEPLLFHP